MQDDGEEGGFRRWASTRNGECEISTLTLKALSLYVVCMFIVNRIDFPRDKQE